MVLPDQLRRRVTYAVFGAIPAILCAWIGDAFDLLAEIATVPWNGLFALRSAGALVGTAGLCAAVAVRIPVQTLWLRVLIACSLIIGIRTMLPYSVSFIYGGFVDMVQWYGIRHLGNVLILFWFWVGPLAVACHFLFMELHRTFKTWSERSSAERQ
jgi:hypothetical protein